ncbi:MAG: FAD/NAD(P)-binding protein [Candidatus Nanopelagicales bacterium]
MGAAVVAVIGAGASGALTAAAILRRAGADVAVRLIDAADSTGRGVAYGTVDRRHLTNVPVARMSADPDAPDDFLHWLRRHRAPQVRVTDYVPRQWFGEYLEGHLARTAERSQARLYRINDEAHSIVPRGGRYRVRLRHGLSMMTDAVVLAVGAPRADAGLLPSALTASPLFCADPWNPVLLHRATDHADRILFVGAGLTMVDLAISLDRPGRKLMAVSRTGLLPAAHARRPPSGILPPPVVPDGVLSRQAAERLIVEQVRRAQAEYGDWRPGIDSLRPVADELWQRLSVIDQRRFARGEGLREWEVRRHRMAPETAERLQEMRDAGRFTVRRATIASARRHRNGGLRVLLSDSTRLHAHAVVDCTGAGIPDAVRQGGNPLLADLVGRGLARINDQGLGLDNDRGGALVSADGRVQSALRVVGHYRRGPVWETTAIPQIRLQAVQVAEDLLAARQPAPVPERTR